MNINRRQFGTLAVAGAAAMTTGGSVLMIDGCSTSWITTLENDLPQLINIASSIISIVSLASGNGTLPAALAPEITAAAQALQASLTLLQDAVNAYNGGKGNGTLAAVSAAVAAVQADAQKVIAALPAGTVSTNLEVAIVSGIGLLVTIISSIQLLMPATPAPTPALAATVDRAKATAAMGKATLPDAATIKAGYNAVLVHCGFGSATI